MKMPSESRGIVTPATGVVCDGETHDMDAGNQSWVPGKSSKFS